MSSSPIKPVLRGACACGRVSYTATEPPTHLDYCYCTPCQRISGAPFVAWMGISKDQLAWSGPGIRSFRLASFASRGCCEACGGTLFMQYDCYPGKTHVAAGTMTNFPKEWTMPRVQTHIFVRSKPAWYQMPEDGVSRWQDWDDEFRASFPEVVQLWEQSELDIGHESR